ncbi:MAG: M20/M25/M40 family metallo-hydrolase, partial [Acidobacteriota bacterium]
LVSTLQGITSRNRDPLKPLVVSLGAIHGGAAPNVIPEEVVISGTVRCFEDGVREMAERRMREVTAGVCTAAGASAEISYLQGIPAVVNDGALAELAIEVAGRTLGRERLVEIAPVMGGEDFACYQQAVPGAFLFFGAGDGVANSHHHAGFDLDERALPEATLLMTALALEFLARASSTGGGRAA